MHIWVNAGSVLFLPLVGIAQLVVRPAMGSGVCGFDSWVSANILSFRLAMKSFLWPFSPYH